MKRKGRDSSSASSGSHQSTRISKSYTSSRKSISKRRVVDNKRIMKIEEKLDLLAEKVEKLVELFAASKATSTIRTSSMFSPLVSSLALAKYVNTAEGFIFILD